MSIEKTLTTPETCEIMRVSPRTLRRWINLGAFPKPLKVAGSVRFRAKDVRAFIDNGGITTRPGGCTGFASFWEVDQSDAPVDQLATDEQINAAIGGEQQYRPRSARHAKPCEAVRGDDSKATG